MKTRLRTINIGILISFFVLTAGLGYLQIVKGDFYYKLSEENRIRLLPLRAMRGVIYDRNGNPLATNRLSFDIALIPQELEDRDFVLKRLGEITGESPARLRHTLDSNYSVPFAPVTILNNVGKEEAFVLKELKPGLSGLLVQTNPQRYYPYAGTSSHITGYLGKIGPGELRRGRRYGYQIEDFVGRTGIEGSFDEYLRGRSGGVQVEVDNRGRHRRTLGLRRPSQGKDIHLTIDIRLQKYLSELLKGKKGAAVVINPQSGEVLSLVSSPGYDSNLFIEGGNQKALREILHHPQSPLLNRAVYGLYPAGSIFKIVVAAAGLDSKKISSRTELFCPGSYKLGDQEFLCWDLDGHKEQTITQALARSCNVFFYKLGMLLGPELISDYAAKFGLGKASGIDLPGEAKGLLPDKSWRRSVKKSRWYDGDTVNFSIGQGYLLVTPLQVARMIAVIANGGHLIKPYLVKKIDNLEVATPRLRRAKLSKETIELIKQGLEGVVSEWGTGYRAKIPGLELIAKTGTAQVERGKSHAWFCGFSPKDNPRVCFVILLEHGGRGGEEVAEMAKELMEFLATTDYLLPDNLILNTVGNYINPASPRGMQSIPRTESSEFLRNSRG